MEHAQTVWNAATESVPCTVAASEAQTAVNPVKEAQASATRTTILAIVSAAAEGRYYPVPFQAVSQKGWRATSVTTARAANAVF